jgi:hypothetical protein
MPNAIGAFPTGNDFLAGDLTSWHVLESLGESVVIVDNRFRGVWIKEPLLAQSKPEKDPLKQYCYSVMFDRVTPCDRHCPIKPVLGSGRPSLVERRFVVPDGIERRREARAHPILDGKRPDRLHCPDQVRRYSRGKSQDRGHLFPLHGDGGHVRENLPNPWKVEFSGSRPFRSAPVHQLSFHDAWRWNERLVADRSAGDPRAVYMNTADGFINRWRRTYRRYDQADGL